MTEQLAQSLGIKAFLNAHGRICVPERMKIPVGQSALLQFCMVLGSTGVPQPVKIYALEIPLKFSNSLHMNSGIGTSLTEETLFGDPIASSVVPSSQEIR